MRGSWGSALPQDPRQRPAKLKKSPSPFVHAVSRAVRRELWEAYAWVVAAYRKAAERLRAGDRDAVFPLGCFPPALPSSAADFPSGRLQARSAD